MLEGKELNNSAQKGHTFCTCCPLYFKTCMRGGCSTQGRNSFIMARECVRGGGRQREREISRQFYLTESFYQSAQQRQEKDKSLTSEGTGVSPHSHPRTHTPKCTSSHTHKQIPRMLLINRTVAEKKERFFAISSEWRKSLADNLTADKMWQQQISNHRLSWQPCCSDTLMAARGGICLSVSLSVCCVVSELLETGGLPMMSRQQ